MKKILLAVSLLALAQPVLAEEAAPAASPSDPVVARYDGKPVYRSEVMQEIASLGAQAAGMPMAAIYPQALEKVIATKIVSEKGYAANVQETPEAKMRLKRAEAQIVADLYMNSVIMPKLTDSKIKERYNELAKKFKPEQEMRASHILLPTKEEADAVIKQLGEGADFAAIAKEKSRDTGSKDQGGDLGFFPRSAMVKPFADAAFAMKKGETSQSPVKTDFGWHVIRVTDSRKSEPPPMESVKGQIQAQLGSEMVGQEVRSTLKNAKIERFNLDGSPLKQAKGDAKSE